MTKITDRNRPLTKEEIINLIREMDTAFGEMEKNRDMFEYAFRTGISVLAAVAERYNDADALRAYAKECAADDNRRFYVEGIERMVLQEEVREDHKAVYAALREGVKDQLNRILTDREIDELLEETHLTRIMGTMFLEREGKLDKVPFETAICYLVDACSMQKETLTVHPDNTEMQIAKKREDDAAEYVKQGFTKLRLNKPEDAITEFDKAIELNPNDDVTYHARGAAKCKLGRLEDAVADFESALGLKAEQHEAGQNQEAARQAYQKAKPFFDAKDFPAALPDLFLAYALDNAHPWAALDIGKSLQAMNALELAKPYFEQARQTPGDAQTWACCHLGQIYEVQGKPAEAQQHYENALQFFGKNKWAQERLKELKHE